MESFGVRRSRLIPEAGAGLPCNKEGECADHAECNEEGTCACINGYNPVQFDCKAGSGLPCKEDGECVEHAACREGGICACIDGYHPDRFECSNVIQSSFSCWFFSFGGSHIVVMRREWGCRATKKENAWNMPCATKREEGSALAPMDTSPLNSNAVMPSKFSPSFFASLSLAAQEENVIQLEGEIAERDCHARRMENALGTPSVIEKEAAALAGTGTMQTDSNARREWGCRATKKENAWNMRSATKREEGSALATMDTSPLNSNAVMPSNFSPSLFASLSLAAQEENVIQLEEEIAERDCHARRMENAPGTPSVIEKEAAALAGAGTMQTDSNARPERDCHARRMESAWSMPSVLKAEGSAPVLTDTTLIFFKCGYQQVIIELNRRLCPRPNGTSLLPLTYLVRLTSLLPPPPPMCTCSSGYRRDGFQCRAGAGMPCDGEGECVEQAECSEEEGGICACVDGYRPVRFRC
ncbi:unnamed protein product, partial [Darwinula stevensoni]